MRNILLPIRGNRNLNKNMTGSSNSLKFDIKYNFLQFQLEFYSVQKYNFISIENRKIAVTIPVISHKPLHGTDSLIINMKSSNNSKYFDTKFNFLRLILPDFYSMKN